MITTAFAATAGQAGTSSMLSQFAPIILMFAIFYFLLIRPQQKKAKEHKLLIENLKKDDKIILSSGIFGTIVSVDNDTLIVEIADRVRIKLLRGNVAEKIDINAPAPSAKPKKTG